ncbi:GntR family transcriptional regulator [Streptomyces amakusaensis]|uniref:GntR family transcriptional regulator n=1 Tax=Streptomyces amakusaensis TaxID=67271 RepID=A0ABW0AMX6_9ACTN
MPSHRHTIADDLRTQITTGRLKPGERLPAETQLATHYSVSTPTLRNALALLQAEGLVNKIHGKGNFVRHSLRHITYLGGSRTTLAQFPSDPALRVSVHTINRLAQGHLATLLKVSARSPLTEFRRIAYEGQSPRSLTRIYVPRDLPPPKYEELAEIQETVTARVPTPEEASTLRISPVLPVLSITRVTTAPTGRVTEAALLTLPGNRAHAIFTTHPTTTESRPAG